MDLQEDPNVGERHVALHRKLRRATVVSCLALLTLGVGFVGTGEAAHVGCGQVITKSTTLDSDVGPCPGHGLIVRAGNIKLNLNGKTVFAANGPQETVGIFLANVKRATVSNGTVTGFDAGVNIAGNQGNTVTGLYVHDNINDNIETANEAEDCSFGDGITTTDSDQNTITYNRVVHNGPFSGIALVGDSDGNTVKGNTVADNNVPSKGAGNPDLPLVRGGNCGREIQDIGVRVEGPGANLNVVEGNSVTNSALTGIALHGHVFAPPDGSTPEPDNNQNRVTSNYVADTGRQTYPEDTVADGIALLRQGPGSIVGVSQGNTIENNSVVRNYRHGIFLGNPTQTGTHAGNTVRNNHVTANRANGIFAPAGSVNNTLTGNTATGNATGIVDPSDATLPVAYDAKDRNANCDANVWSGNVFGTVNQPCVK